MEIPEISDLDCAFGNVKHLPNMEDIPEEFKEWNNGTVWNKAFNEWFFAGCSNAQFIPKDGVDRDKALKFISANMASWEPSQEHKEAGCAFLMSKYFKDFIPKGELKQ